MREFIAVVRANPGKYQYATRGVATTGELIMEWIRGRTGIRIEAVPCPSIPAIVQDMLGGIVEIAFLDSGTAAAPLARSGRLKVLGISGAAIPRDAGRPADERARPGIRDRRLVRPLRPESNVPGSWSSSTRKRRACCPPRRCASGSHSSTLRDDFAVWRQPVQNNNIRLR